MVGHKFGEFAPTRTFHGHSSRQEGEEGLIMGKPKRERVLSEPRRRRAQHDPHLGAEAQPRGRADPRQEGATALADLTFSRKRIAGDVKKTLESAVANAENNHQLDVDSLSSPRPCRQALMLKRWTPRGRGRVGRSASASRT
jgi:large subunit ribosomal protein L22